MTYRLSTKMPNKSRAVNEKEEGKQKFFFVIEGEKTEKIYIEEVAQNIKKEPLVEVVILERIQSSQSNQFRITSTIKNYIDINVQLSSNTKNQLLDLNRKFEEGELTESELLDNLEGILGEAKDSLIIEHNDSIIEQIRALNKLNTYEAGLDKICLILDRDYRSFKDDQYDKVIGICNENSFLLGVTNPNFEFYLLLHLINAESLDPEKIKRNANSTRKKKYVEYHLNNEMKVQHRSSYRKNKFDAKLFVYKFSNLKENIKIYAEDNLKLKNEVGSSVHHIINHLID